MPVTCVGIPRLKVKRVQSRSKSVQPRSSDRRSRGPGCLLSSDLGTRGLSRCHVHYSPQIPLPLISLFQVLVPPSQLGTTERVVREHERAAGRTGLMRGSGHLHDWVVFSRQPRRRVPLSKCQPAKLELQRPTASRRPAGGHWSRGLASPGRNLQGPGTRNRDLSARCTFCRLLCSFAVRIRLPLWSLYGCLHRLQP